MSSHPALQAWHNEVLQGTRSPLIQRRGCQPSQPSTSISSPHHHARHRAQVTFSPSGWTVSPHGVRGHNTTFQQGTPLGAALLAALAVTPDTGHSQGGNCHDHHQCPRKDLSGLPNWEVKTKSLWRGENLATKPYVFHPCLSGYGRKSRRKCKAAPSLQRQVRI